MLKAPGTQYHRMWLEIRSLKSWWSLNKALRVRPQSNRSGVFTRGGINSRDVQLQRKAASCKPRKKASKHKPNSTCISDFQPPELWKLCFCQATLSVVFCSGSPTKLIQPGGFKPKPFVREVQGEICIQSQAIYSTQSTTNTPPSFV